MSEKRKNYNKWKYVYLSSTELEGADWYLNSEQTLLHILKEKGAPVDGIIYLKADMENYVWERHHENIDRIRFGFAKKEEAYI